MSTLQSLRRARTKTLRRFVALVNQQRRQHRYVPTLQQLAASVAKIIISNRKGTR